MPARMLGTPDPWRRRQDHRLPCHRDHQGRHSGNGGTRRYLAGSPARARRTGRRRPDPDPDPGGKPVTAGHGVPARLHLGP
jgi:hypothetical protein